MPPPANAEVERTVSLTLRVKTYGKHEHVIKAAQEVRRLVEARFGDVEIMVYNPYRWTHVNVPRSAQEIEHPQPHSS